MFGLIFIPLLTLHLLLVNVAMAGPFVCLWLEWRGTRRDDILAAKIGERLARDAFWALLVGGVLGAAMVGLLWISDDAAYFRGVQAVPRSRLWAALGELLFSLALMAIYTFAWNWFAKLRWLHRAIAFLAATNLAYHFPLLFGAISLLTGNPDSSSKTLSSAEFRSLLFDPIVISQAVHVWLASVAVVGTLMMFYALGLRKKKNRSTDDLGPTPARVAGWGAWLALIPSVLQLLVGLWVLLELPDRSRAGLMGGNMSATIVFALGLLAALRLMHLLASIALGDRRPRQLVSAIATMGITVLLMSATLHISSGREDSNRQVNARSKTALAAGVLPTSFSTFPSVRIPTR